jgi:PAS domain S-box-containing protein
MKEVSCRAFEMLLEPLRERGVPLEPLVRGLPVTIAELQSPQSRIDWDTFATLLERVRETAGGDAALEEMGESILRAKTFRSARAVGGLFARPRQLFRMSIAWLAPTICPHLEFTLERREGEALEIAIEIPPPYRDCPEFFRLCAGSIRVAPRFMGCREDAVVDARIAPRRAVYFVTPPISRSLFARLRMGLRALLATGSAIDELRTQQQELRESYAALAAAHERITEQARELRAVNVIGHALARRIELDSLADTLVDLLDEHLGCHGVALWAKASPDEELELVRSAGTPPRSGGRSYDLESAGRLVGRLQTWEPEGVRAPDRPVALEKLLPWIAIALDNACSFAALRRNTERLEDEMLARRGLEEARFRLASIVESSDDAIVGKTLGGVITSWNQGAEQLYGYAADEMIGQPMSVLSLPGREDEVASMLGRLTRGETIERTEGARRRKDGTIVDVSITVSPIKSPDGVLLGASTIARDITERKRAEAALAQRARDLARSNADLEQFAHVASHDMQEPLRMVASYVQLLAQRYKGQLDPDADTFIEYAVDGAARMQQLIRDLLAFSRASSPGQEAQSLESEALLADALSNLKGAIQRYGAEVVSSGLPRIHGQRTLLTQLFQNLIDNAIKYRSEAPPRIEIGAAPGVGEWVFTVRDNGIGFNRQYAGKIFRIFQRLHDRGTYAGSGIGLAIAKRIVEQHGGRIWCDSEPGRGSSFSFSIPIVPEGGAPGGVAGGERRKAPLSGRIVP